jgi:peptidoglycan hydrolase CwlO-like protein
MFNFNIYGCKNCEINSITSKLQEIMSTLADLEVKIAELQATVDAEQEQIASLVNNQNNTIVALESQIAELQAMLAVAPTPEQIQAVVDSLEGIKNDVASTIA